ncbi:NOP protein chaperone 1 isoform 3-T3 [Lycodopsis pacificus]
MRLLEQLYLRDVRLHQQVSLRSFSSSQRPADPCRRRESRGAARLQSFLPQMAEANEKLKQQMADAPAGHFDIESVGGAESVIEMDLALVELSGSDGDSEGETSDSEEESDSAEGSEVTEQNLVLPGDKGKKKKANIQVLHQQGE